MVGAGLVLGEAYDEYGIWITLSARHKQLHQ